MTFTEILKKRPSADHRGGLDVWRATGLILAAIAVLLVVLVLVFLTGKINSAFIACWTAVALAGLGLTVVTFAGLAHLVTPRGEAVSGSSIIAVAFAFAIASVASPPAVESAVHGTDRLFGAAFDLTPTLVLRATNGEPLCPMPVATPSTTDAPEGAVALGRTGDTLTPPPQVPAAKPPVPEIRSADQLSLVKAEIISRVFSYIAHGESTCLAGADRPPELDQDLGRGARVWFMIVLGVGLLLGRTFAEARRDWYAQQDREELDTDADTTEVGTRRPIITYPKWIAAVIYATILAPASYLAIGALLYLSLDTAAIDQADFKNRLDSAEARAMSSDIMEKADLDSGALLKTVAAPSATMENEYAIIRRSITSYYALQARFDTLRREEKRLAIEHLHEADRTYSPSKIPAYADYLVESYYNTVLQTRAKVRACLAGLSPIQAVIGKNGETVANLANVKNLTSPLDERCKPPATDDASEPDSEPPPRGSIIESVMFGWMIGMPKTTILIIGLLGFGLFGAAIRMLGRPDHPEVMPQNDDDKTLQNMVQDLLERAASVRAGAGAVDAESADNRRKRLCEIAALKALTIQINALARQEHAERNNIIYTRSEYAIDNQAGLKVRERVAVSSAPARVLVHGMGAAFTVFLMGESGARFFSDGGKTSPIGLVALCFIGAVFAEDIWRRAHDFLGRQISPSSPPTGGPSPPVTAPVGEDARAAEKAPEKTTKSKE